MNTVMNYTQNSDQCRVLWTLWKITRLHRRGEFLPSWVTTKLCDLMFSQRCCWRFKPSGVWPCVTGWIFPDISEDSNTIIFSGKQSNWTTWIFRLLRSLKTSLHWINFYTAFLCLNGFINKGSRNVKLSNSVCQTHGVVLFTPTFHSFHAECCVWA